MINYLLPELALLIMMSVLSAAVSIAPGCASYSDQAELAHPMLPPDFALQFHVEGNPTSGDPLRMASQYIVEPNRRFRVATGGIATVGYFPQQARMIDRAEFYDLARHVMTHHLMAEPTSPASENPHVAVRYDVEITAHGHTHRYSTTPEESPPTLRLLIMLATLHEPS